MSIEKTTAAICNSAVECTIAIPTTNGSLSQHFGHCEIFYFAKVNQTEILKEWYLTPPVHEPGLYPKWVKEQGAELVIAGGMGKKACDLFKQNGISICTGAESLNPSILVKEFLSNTLQLSNNACENHEHTCE